MIKLIPSLVTVVEGSAPLVITCPHDGELTPAITWPRIDWGDPGFTTIRDVRTREVVERLRSHLNATSVVAEFSRKYVDANRQRPIASDSILGRWYFTAYHHAIERAARPHRSNGLLLDVHGTRIDDAELYLGDRDHETCDEGLTSELQALLEHLGYRVILNHPRLCGGYTTVRHSRYINALQLEIQRKLRDCPRALAKLVADLTTALEVVLNLKAGPQG